MYNGGEKKIACCERHNGLLLGTSHILNFESSHS